MIYEATLKGELETYVDGRRFVVPIEVTFPKKDNSEMMRQKAGLYINQAYLELVIEVWKLR